MTKKKFTLDDLQVESFVTSLETDQLAQVKGGLNIVRGRRYNYNTRWTAVDTRTESPEVIVMSNQG
jgi:hypothetical protein